MSRIGGWVRDRFSGGSQESWTNTRPEKRGLYARIVLVNRDRDGSWTLARGHGMNPLFSKHATKADALKEAYWYMRANPDG